MSTSIAAIVVVYNKNVSDSLTCRNILKMESYTLSSLVIVDNSTQKNENEKYCIEHEIQYLPMKENAGLSKAYNCAIKQISGVEIYVLLDDDTEITENYFQCLENTITNYPEVDIFAPIIRGQNGVIYSPNESSFLKNHIVNDKEQSIPQDKFNAIASCLAIRKRIFDGYVFNEKLFVDQVDQNFFDDQRKLKRKFMKLDVEIHQNFYQRGSTLTAEAGWRRLRLRIVDIFRYARLKNNFCFVILAFVKCCGLGVQIGRKSKSLKVIFNAAFLSSYLFVRPK